MMKLVNTKDFSFWVLIVTDYFRNDDCYKVLYIHR